MLFSDVCLLAKFTALFLSALQLETTGKLPEGKEIPGLWRGAMPVTQQLSQQRAHKLWVMKMAKWPLVMEGKGDKMIEPSELITCPWGCSHSAQNVILFAKGEICTARAEACAQSLPTAPRGVGCCSNIPTKHPNPLLVHEGTLWEC